MMWLKHPKPTHLAYMAGFFDGEGTVAISKEPNQGFILQCMAVNTVRTPLDFIQSYFDGTVLGPTPREGNWKPVFNWKVEAVKAEVFLRSVGPYLQIKRERCELGLEFRQLFHGEFVLPRGKEKYLPDNAKKRQAIMELRFEFYERMKVLNHRGLI